MHPNRIVAIGRDAGEALAVVGVPVAVVRHPSHGGRAEGIGEIYGIER